MRRLHAFLRDRSGANAVEFALLAGPLMLIMLGTIEFGRAQWAQQVIQEVAIASARCMGVPQSGCMSGSSYNAAASVTFARTMASGRGVTLAISDVAINHNATCYGITGFSSVTITHTFDSALPSFISALASGPTMHATSCFPNQGS